MTLDPQSLIQLRERIALAKGFSPDERTLMLDALNLGDYSGRHEYPSRHGPGADPWTDAAWAILDQLRPGKLARNDRFMLGGMIAGALQQMFETGKLAAAGRSGAASEIHAPPNKLARIETLYAALSVDAAGEGLCAGPIGQYGVAPLVCTEERHVGVITDIARGIARATKRTVRMVRFTGREPIEEIVP